MKIKNKTNAQKVAEDLKKAKKGESNFEWEFPSIYFYNKEEKTYNYLSNKNGEIVHISFVPDNEENTHQQIKVDAASYIWKYRKYINKTNEGIKCYAMNESKRRHKEMEK